MRTLDAAVMERSAAARDRDLGRLALAWSCTSLPWAVNTRSLGPLRACPAISVSRISGSPPSRTRWIEGIVISAARQGPVVPPFWQT